MSKRVAPFRILAALLVGGAISSAYAQETQEGQGEVLSGPPPKVRTVELITGQPEATSSNVPLSGAGKISMPLDTKGLEFGLNVPPGHMELGVKVWFDAAGKATDCSFARYDNLGSYDRRRYFQSYKVLREQICAQALENWSFELADWYGAKVDRGFATVDFRLTPTVKLAEPLEATRYLPAASIRVDYWVREGEEPTCKVRTALTDPAQAAAICEFVLADPENNLMPMKEGRPTPFRSTRPLLIDWSETSLKILPRPSFKNLDVTSLLYRRLDRELPDGSLQDIAAINFESRLSTRDNPAWRTTDPNWRGRTLSLLGIDDKGRVRTCVPLRTSGSALVDNGVCAAMVRKSRAAKGKALAGQDYRYVVAPAVWKPAH
ncbi:hypothetical protein [Qipengyuania gelatinilytica]|uniref:TonB C-terminal domain-containing protein n=1 Tax=Qipengyuania gelatinilytica TaxID=2867231 RepID=A0ABX9A3F5_9SPHN|nr:hypothetical protein [Qipengyuania gelatinilytica]QZD95807.1 hypothetical protein K3136_03550 [Qipengyuania gelatinilytica]